MENIVNLVFQLAVILFAVRIFGKLSAKAGIPTVLGELLAGIVIGPFALGKIGFPGFTNGLFPLMDGVKEVSQAYPELYAIAQIASIILLFSSGLETDLSLFLKYSVSGGIIGIGGVVISFVFGDVAAMYMIRYLNHSEMLPSFTDVSCLFFGVMSTATSVGITARILSDKKRMDSAEGVTILAAAVFDDVLGIVLLAIINGIAIAAKEETGSGAGLSVSEIGLIAFKAMGIWLAATVLSVIFSKKIAKFVRFFGGTYDFSIAAFGVALVLAGIFEKQGLAMIIGAYTTGLALSKTDIAPVIQERIHGIYKFFVPVFFAVTGMSVDVTQLMDKSVICCGLIFTLICIASKLIGCGSPALGLGFNVKGAFRIGAGMIPRGEVALIIAGIGLSAGIVDQKLFGIVIMMTLLTTLFAPPILNIALGLKGRGTKKEIAKEETQVFEWDFENSDIAHLVIDMIFHDLRAEGFYVQMMNINEGLFQARKGDCSLSAKVVESKIVIETAAQDMGFVKGEVYEAMLRFKKSLKSMEALSNANSLTGGIVSAENRVGSVLFKYLDLSCISTDLKGNTKEEVLSEMVGLLEKSGKVNDSKILYDSILEREKSMTTGLGNGIAIPHGKCSGVSASCVAIGIKKDGIDFRSLDGKPVNIIVMIASPLEGTAPHLRVMAAVSGSLMQEEIREKLLKAGNAKKVVEILKETKK